MGRRLLADLDTLQRVRVVLASAMNSGRDPAEELDRAGLLLFAERTSQITANVLFEAADTLDQLTVRQLAGEDRLSTSPADTKRQVCAWLRGQAQAIKDTLK